MSKKKFRDAVAYIRSLAVTVPHIRSYAISVWVNCNNVSQPSHRLADPGKKTPLSSNSEGITTGVR